MKEHENILQVETKTITYNTFYVHFRLFSIVSRSEFAVNFHFQEVQENDNNFLI